MGLLTVGNNKQFSTLSAAVDASQKGDVIAVDAGTYTNDFATIRQAITIEGVGGMVNLVATQSPPNGKAILTVDADATIVNVAFSGAAVGDGNGAGIRDEAGNLTLVADYFHDNQDGLLAGDDPSARIDIYSSQFASNGANDGRTHNLYVNQLGTLNIVDSYFHDAVGGNEIKSRALTTTITGTRVIDGPAQTTGGYDVDLPNGGNAVLTGNTIEKGANEPNTTLVHFGGEAAPYAGSVLTLSGNLLVNDDLNSRSPGRAVTNDQSAGAGATANVVGNTLYNVTSANVLNGPGTASGNTLMSGSATLDTKAPVLAVVSAAVGPAVSAAVGQAVNPFATTVLSVLDDLTATVTLGGAQHGTLAYRGGDSMITVTAAGGSLVVTGDAARIVSDLQAGTFTYTGAASSGTDTVTATFSDPGLFLTQRAGQSAAAAPALTESIVSAACFVTGTLIAVPGGQRPVEQLAIGDPVVTADGTVEPIRWIGRRSYAGRFLAGRPALWPVRIAAGALAEGVPSRDLLMSPKHAMAFGDVLIPAEALVNGVTIRREAGWARVDYVHVELARHTAIWAEGAASETFCDEDSRGLFENAAEYALLYPDAMPMPPRWRRLEHGAIVDGVRRGIMGRVAA